MSSSTLLASRLSHLPYWNQRISSVTRMMGFLTVASPIQPPAELVIASLQDVQAILPFSWQIAQYRHRSLESRGVDVYFKKRSGPLTPSKVADYDIIRPREPGDSYLQLVYPFSSSSSLRDQYRRFNSDRLRWGLLLEDMDALAGDIAALHAGLRGGRTPVTAFVDRFSCMADLGAGEQVSLNHDLRLDGQVTWVGRTSMEVLIALSSRVLPTTSTASPCSSPSPPTQILTSPSSPDNKGSASGHWSHVGFARFVMAMRKAVEDLAVPVPPLLPVAESDKVLFKHGVEHHVQCKKKRENHWRITPPSDEEVKLIHQLAVSHLTSPTAKTITGAPAQPPTAPSPSEAVAQKGEEVLPSVPMHVTELRTAVLMHSQDRNSNNRIFGGHLMRLAFEHAYTVAVMHAGGWVDPVSMEDVIFIQPVPIGAVMQLRGKVVYTEGHFIRVLVEALLFQPGGQDKKEIMTNDFSFSFLYREGPVRPVMPDTVVEALEYVLGQRQHLEAQEHHLLTDA